MSIYTKEYIQNKLMTDQRWTERGLIVLYNRQTTEEQETKDTRFLNGRGFNGTDGRYLTWCSEWLIKGRHLSGHHLEKVRKKICKYWKQIQEEIESKGNK